VQLCPLRYNSHVQLDWTHQSSFNNLRSLQYSIFSNLVCEFERGFYLDTDSARLIESGIYRNPIFHQVVFATLVLLIVCRVEMLIRFPAAGTPNLSAEIITELRKEFGFGFATFILGFVIWNLDNIFCVNITRWKHTVQWPAAFLLEGCSHSMI
jgi:Ceramidase